MIYPIILAGGSGTRLWPVSRSLYPKQFISLYNKNSLFQNTMQRLTSLDIAQPIVICNEEHRFIVAEQLQKIGSDAIIILEKQGRDTAPAITIAAMVASIRSQSEDPNLLVLSADHYIEDVDGFSQSIDIAIEYSLANKIVTFGIEPNSAHTGYGYIHRGWCLDDNTVFDIEEFVEKPDKAKAQQYLDSGEYYWNCGIFMFLSSTILKEVKSFQPEIFECCNDALINVSFDQDFIRVDEGSLAGCESKSIDYAVIEHTAKAAVVVLNSKWCDIGSWSSLWSLLDKDENGNVTQGDVVHKNTNNCLIHSKNRLVTAVGLEDIIIVETQDAVLVVHKDQEQEIKSLVNTLKAEGHSEYHHHREVFRPWGKYDSIDAGNRYQVKHITVKPGEKLSVQKHLHRAEHWTVVCGTAHVLNGEKNILLTENQSTYIPIGAVHSLENKGKIPLEIIEVQTGAYLGEDDIIRFEDVYGRVEETASCKS